MHCYKNALIRFRVRLMIPNCETHQIHQIPGQQTKCSITTYVFSLSYQLSYIWFPCYHYINYWFIHLFYIFCMLNVVKMWQGNIVLQNISGVTEGYIGCHCAILERKIALFIGIQKCYQSYPFIFCLIFTFRLLWENATTCSFRRVAKIIHNESFKENNRSIGMCCAVVWFHRVHLQKQSAEVFLNKCVLKNSAKFTGRYLCWSLFPALLFVPCGEIWLGLIHDLTSAGRLL